jgi:hypothetical protein
MPLDSIPRRSFAPPTSEPMPINWRRGLFRVWVLLSAAWVMSWLIYLIVDMLRNGFQGSDLLIVPILLFGPPLALLIFGMAAGWAFRGFRALEESQGLTTKPL